ncbi:hypothetical protein [Aquimarina brevivitae]|uniref:hypothetical protein n=1 Tax=Aquimarina brevivitae TaxID=323412 RepID=UPI00102A192F|nr:hypothetical protein [Aquimarina brevivitae]
MSNFEAIHPEHHTQDALVTEVSEHHTQDALVTEVSEHHHCDDHNHANMVAGADTNTIIASAIKDFLSSDEGADFNCSGGFCMNENHYHKKGLTAKRQYFFYFLKIAC